MANNIIIPSSIFLSMSALVYSLLFLGSIGWCYGQRYTVGSTLFTFGDSTYDVGNKQFLSSDDVRANLWPYGISIDRPSGRWSDGRILPDFIAEFNKMPTIPPILNETANFTHGASFAIADATVLGSPSETMTLTDQVLKFYEHKTKWTTEVLAKAVFMLYIGTDDYLNYTKYYPKASADDQQAFVDRVIAGVNTSLVALYDGGARKFAVQNLGPAGCLPIVKQDYKTGDKCVEQLTHLAELHNNALKPLLEQLAVSYPGFQYNYFDYFGATIRRFGDAFHYRLSDTNNACCGIGSHNAYGCGDKYVHSNVCSNQRSSLYYDGRHNAQKTNEAMAHLFYGGDKVVVRPMNLRELYTYPVGLSMLES